MSKSRTHYDTANQLRRLTPDEINNPHHLIEDFFQNYHLQEIREALWEWLCAGLSSAGGHFQTGRDRSNLLFFYENLEKLAEASFVLHSRKVKRDKKKS